LHFALKTAKQKMKVVIKENSALAWTAAKVLREKRVAIVFGNTIHLTNSTKADFLKDKSWVLHELAHVRQYRKHGFIKFISLYLVDCVKNGYINNRFEKEARQLENDHTLLLNIEFT
jgi:hypothetical protein